MKRVEASPVPLDNVYLFERFLEMMGEGDTVGK